MVVKSQIKLIKSLGQKKYRAQYGLFVAEGVKLVQELLDSGFTPYRLFLTEGSALLVAEPSAELVTTDMLKRLSGLATPNKALGVFHIPKAVDVDFKDWVVALDEVRDPGNLGTIIRLCDWFGIRHLVCSKHSVDCYNPKVLQATMGSIARVNVVYADLSDFLQKADTTIYGTFMGGDNLYTVRLPTAGILVMGNEANGISKSIEALVSQKLGIPQFGGNTAESLNVAMAASIVLSEIRSGLGQSTTQK